MATQAFRRFEHDGCVHLQCWCVNMWSCIPVSFYAHLRAIVHKLTDRKISDIKICWYLLKIFTERNPYVSDNKNTEAIITDNLEEIICIAIGVLKMQNHPVNIISIDQAVSRGPVCRIVNMVSYSSDSLAALWCTELPNKFFQHALFWAACDSALTAISFVVINYFTKNNFFNEKLKLKIDSATSSRRQEKLAFLTLWRLTTLIGVVPHR